MEENDLPRTGSLDLATPSKPTEAHRYFEIQYIRWRSRGQNHSRNSATDSKNLREYPLFA